MRRWEYYPSQPGEAEGWGKMAAFQTPIDSLPSQLHFPSPRANQLLITAAQGEHQRDLIMVGKCQITLNLNQIPDIQGCAVINNQLVRSLSVKAFLCPLLSITRNHMLSLFRPQQHEAVRHSNLVGGGTIESLFSLWFRFLVCALGSIFRSRRKRWMPFVHPILQTWAKEREISPFSLSWESQRNKR